MEQEIVVIDYHKGNIASVVRGLRSTGAQVRISDEPEVISHARVLVLPGVGSFGDAMRFLRASGQDRAILHAIEKGVPFLGICLGQQLLFEWGYEGHPDELDEQGRVAGLGVLPGSCVLLSADGVKVPHVGWDQVAFSTTGRQHPLTSNLADGLHFYFTHSYVVEGAQPSDVLAITDYGVKFPSIVGREHVCATQFHPEKSSSAGAQLLAAFVQMVSER